MRLLVLRSVLVATDLDDASAPAVRAATQLAALAGAELSMLHVAADTKAITTTEPPGVKVLSGNPAEVIVEYAQQVDADVIVLGPHRGGGSHPLGSTAAQVVNNATCPCLVVGAELVLPLRHILVPVDLSEIAGGGLAVAFSWASALRSPRTNAPVTVLHITEAESSATKDAVHEEVERALKRAGGAAPVAVVEKIHSGNDPVDSILYAIKSEGADLVVMGTRGIGNAATALGSVATSVANVAHFPLLLVPPAVWESEVDAEEIHGRRVWHQPRAYPDIIDDTLDDSFPASDPPSWAGR